MHGSGSSVWAASAAATTPLLNALPNSIPKGFFVASSSMSKILARCFFRGLPINASSGRLAEPKVVFGKVALGTELESVSAGGVAP